MAKLPESRTKNIKYSREKPGFVQYSKKTATVDAAKEKQNWSTAQISSSSP